MQWMLRWAPISPWFWAWVVAELVSLPAFPHCHYPGELSSSASAAYPGTVSSKKCGPWSGPQIWPTRWLGPQIWPTHTPPGSVLLFCPGEVLGPLSQPLQGYMGEGRSHLLLSHPQDWLPWAPNNRSAPVCCPGLQTALLSPWNSLKGTSPLSLGCVPIASG